MRWSAPCNRRWTSRAKLPEPAKPYRRNYDGPWPKTPGRLLGVGLVRFYQLTLSGFIGNSCRFMPTCSEYAYEAIARHGLWRGGRLAAHRLARCGPWRRIEGSHEHDPVPD
ncbi:MAG: membrane protein insertion efficiency factor YidD [Rhizobiaceae bacterium]|nr:membrane protein insertion efficiency factor YidD [Hyphomicrobiales bacterium]NRB31220.1 membrane protein insertion efficiency factor YidD [Rhizobiaceae bacterium]